MTDSVCPKCNGAGRTRCKTCGGSVMKTCPLCKGRKSVATKVTGPANVAMTAPQYTSGSDGSVRVIVNGVAQDVTPKQPRRV